MKQKLIALLAIVLAVASPAWAQANLIETITYTDGIVYNLYQDGETRYAEVGANSTAAGASENYSCADLVIPSSVTYEDVTYNVTAIAANAFNYCDGLTGSLTIPEGVTSISDKAFYYCYRLTSLSLPDGLSTIGEQAFRNCNGLGSITIPGSVSSMGKQAFSSCSGAKTLTIEAGVTTIPEEAFGYCYNLQTISIPNTVTTIGNSAFTSDNFQEITIPDGVTEIGQYAFSNCSHLQSITIPNSVESIGSFAFKECWGLKSVKLPENPKYKYLSASLFYYCSGLTTLTIPSQITSIGGEAFNKCSNLKRLYVPTPIVPTAQPYAIPSSVVIYVRKNLMSEFENATNWSGHTFSAFQNYIKYYTDANARIAIDETANFGTGVAFQANFIDGKEGEKYVGYIDFSEKPTEIPANFFKDKEALTGIVIPSGIKTIGADAFSGCANLSSLTFFTPSKPAIDASSFDGTTSLSEVYLREVAKSGFETDAFWSGKTLKYFKNIKYKTNDGKALDFASLKDYGDDIQFIGDFYDELYGGYIEYLGNVTTIPASAFVNRTNLTELTIPDGVTTIGSSAFSGCSALTAMELPEGLEKINSGLFNGCSSLKEVTIPSTVTECNASSTFGGCSNLEAAYMLTPKAPTIVWGSGSLFYGKDNLVVYVRGAARSSYGTGESWEYGKLGIIKEIKYFTDDEKAVTPSKTTGFGDEVRYIASFYEEDKNGNKWGSMMFTKDPTAIPAGAFENCDKLTEVRIPENVTSFGDGVFAGCEKLKSVILLSSIPAETVSTATFPAPASGVTVYVRKSALGKYTDYTNYSQWNGISVEAMPYIKYTTNTNAKVERNEASKNYFPANLDYLGSNIDESASTEGNYVGYMEFTGVLTEIPMYLFLSAKTLTSVTIPAGVTKLGDSAFSGCEALTKVNYESFDKLTEIGTGAFGNCKNLAVIDIPGSVTKIGANAFSINGNDSYFSNEPDIKFYGTLAQWCGIEFGSANANPMIKFKKYVRVKDSDGNDLFGTDLVIPESVTEVKDYAFYRANITSLDLKNVTKVGKESFRSTGLTTLTINKELTEMDQDAFTYSGFNTLNYNIENAETLANKPYSPDYLTTVNIGANVKGIPADAFLDCSLTGVTYGGGLEGWCGITFGNEKANPLSCSTDVLDLIINNNEKVSEVTIPVAKVKDYTFCNSSIEKLTIPETVTSIAGTAFSGCTALTEITAEADQPLALAEGTFAAMTKTNVPLNGYMDYKAADGWKTLDLKTKAGKLDLSDTKPYTIDFALEGCDLSYKRKFPNDKWQGLFLPFGMSYEDWEEEGQMAELTCVDNGVLEWTILGDGSQTVAGKPYIFKPKAFEGDEVENGRSVTFSVTNADLASCVEDAKKPVNALNKGTEVESGYILSGTYTVKDDMADEKAYALSAGNFYYTTSNSKTLKPYRIFLTVPEELSSSSDPNHAPVRNRINGEDVTAIEGIEAEILPAAPAYNLHGVRVGNSYKGIVIVNGKKVLRK